VWIAIAFVVVIFLAALMVFGSYVSAKNQMVANRRPSTRSGPRWTWFCSAVLI